MHITEFKIEVKPQLPESIARLSELSLFDNREAVSVKG
jgi:hypothetical protein